VSAAAAPVDNLHSPERAATAASTASLLDRIPAVVSSRLCRLISAALLVPPFVLPSRITPQQERLRRRVTELVFDVAANVSSVNAPSSWTPRSLPSAAAPGGAGCPTTTRLRPFGWP